MLVACITFLEFVRYIVGPISRVWIQYCAIRIFFCKYVTVSLIVLCSHLWGRYVGPLRNNTRTWWLLVGWYGTSCFLSLCVSTVSFGVSCWSVVSKRTGSSCEMLVDSRFNSFGFVGKSFLSFRITFSLDYLFSSDRDEKTAALIIFRGLCAMIKLKCSTKLQAIHKGWGIFFVLKNLVADLLPDIIITGLVATQNIYPNPLKAK